MKEGTFTLLSVSKRLLRQRSHAELTVDSNLSVVIIESGLVGSRSRVSQMVKKCLVSQFFISKSKGWVFLREFSQRQELPNARRQLL